MTSRSAPPPETVPLLMVPVSINIVCLASGFQVRNTAVNTDASSLSPTPQFTHQILLVPPMLSSLSPHFASPLRALPELLDHGAPDTESPPVLKQAIGSKHTVLPCVSPQCGASSLATYVTLRTNGMTLLPSVKTFCPHPNYSIMSANFNTAYVVFHIWPKLNPRAPTPALFTRPPRPPGEWPTQLCRHATPFRNTVSLHGLPDLEFFSLLPCVTNSC